MKLKAKLKSLLFLRSGILVPDNQAYCHTTTTTSATTTTSTTATTTTTLTETATKMPRDYPAAPSTSMMDLSGRNTAENQERLRRARSVWDVGAKIIVRRRRQTECAAPERPARVVRPTSFSSPSGDDRPQSHNRLSTIQRGESTAPAHNYRKSGLPQRLSSSSTSSTPITPVTPVAPTTSSPSSHGHDAQVFRNEVNLSEARSMMSLPRPYSTSNGSDDDPRGLRKKSAGALHALKNLSRSTPAMSPSASPRHSDSEGPPRISKGTKKFMRHFADAPASEWVLNYFSCALVSDILLQGTLFITPNYFAFYSKIFGHVSKLMIPVTQVATIQKERTAKIIPNAVGLHMLDGKSYVFGSLLSRDSTYKLMLHIWKKAQRIADSDSEPPLSAVPVVSVYERW
nr:GRAM domain-containing protein 2B-like isoform X1 [Cherax quadricarinatus]